MQAVWEDDVSANQDPWVMKDEAVARFTEDEAAELAEEWERVRPSVLRRRTLEEKVDFLIAEFALLRVQVDKLLREKA